MTGPEASIHRRNELTRHARAFLQDLLAGGPQPFQTIHQQAVAQGISKATLMAAKRSLNVQSRKSDGYAVWNLPAAA
jgi:hypothetical protein